MLSHHYAGDALVWEPQWQCADSLKGWHKGAVDDDEKTELGEDVETLIDDDDDDFMWELLRSDSDRPETSEDSVPPTPTSDDLVMIHDLCAKANIDSSYDQLLAEVSKLAGSFFAELEDISTVACREGWTVVALAIPDSLGAHELVGYMTYNAEPTLGGLCLGRIGVNPKHRRCGFASQLVRWMIDRTKAEGYEDLWVHAVPKLQTINKALGFSYVDPADEKVPDEDKKSAWMLFSHHVESLGKSDVAKLSRRQTKAKRRKAR